MAVSPPTSCAHHNSGVTVLDAFAGDGLAVVEDLYQLGRLEACMPPKVPVPKPGPCPGPRRGKGVTKAVAKKAAPKKRALARKTEPPSTGGTPTRLSTRDFEAQIPLHQRLYRGVTVPAAAASTRDGVLGNGDYGHGIYVDSRLGSAQSYSGGRPGATVMRMALTDDAVVRKPPEKVRMGKSSTINAWADDNGVDVVDLDFYKVIRNPGVMIVDERDFTPREVTVLEYLGKKYLMPDGYEDEIATLRRDLGIAIPDVGSNTLPPVYTGPAVVLSDDDWRKIELFKRLRRAENDPDLRGEEITQARHQTEQARKDLSPVMRARAVQEARIEEAGERFRTGGEGEPSPVPEVRRQMVGALERMFAGKKIATRITADGLEKVLRDGRFKTQFETGESGLPGGYVPDERAKIEHQLFGIPVTGFDPARRPYYGYVQVSGQDVSPADFGMLNAYGPVEVVFRDEVRDRTTAMVGDSINDDMRAKPSPVNAPEFWSFKPTRLQPGDFRHDPAGEVFRNGEYAEAQIHDGVTTTDIERVVFSQPPPPGLRELLEAQGIPWRVIPKAG